MPLYRWKKYSVGYDESITSGKAPWDDEESDYEIYFEGARPNTYPLISSNKPIPQPDGSYLFDTDPSSDRLGITTSSAMKNVHYDKYISCNSNTSSRKTANPVYYVSEAKISYRGGSYVFSRNRSFSYVVYRNEGVKYTDLNEYVYSSNPNAYPNGGVSGDFYYDSRTEFKSVESIGVANVARMVTAKDIGVSGIARKCKSGYVGVSGVSRRYFVPIK